MDIELLKVCVPLISRFQARFHGFAKQDISSPLKDLKDLNAFLLRASFNSKYYLTYCSSFCNVRQRTFLDLVYVDGHDDFRVIEFPLSLLYLPDLWKDFWESHWTKDLHGKVAIATAITERQDNPDIKSSVEADAQLLDFLLQEVSDTIKGLRQVKLPEKAQWDRESAVFEYLWKINIESFYFDFAQNLVFVRDEAENCKKIPLLLLATSQQEKEEFMLFNANLEKKFMCLKFKDSWMPQKKHKQLYRELFRASPDKRADLTNLFTLL